VRCLLRRTARTSRLAETGAFTGCARALRARAATRAAGRVAPRASLTGAAPRVRAAQLNVLLGEGSFKTVYKGFDDEQAREVAWNVVKFGSKANSQTALSQAEKQVEMEIELLQNLHHPNIINFFGHFRGAGDRLVFITEMMTSGTLKE